VCYQVLGVSGTLEGSVMLRNKTSHCGYVDASFALWGMTLVFEKKS